MWLWWPGEFALPGRPSDWTEDSRAQAVHGHHCTAVWLRQWDGEEGTVACSLNVCPCSCLSGPCQGALLLGTALEADTQGAQPEAQA